MTDRLPDQVPDPGPDGAQKRGKMDPELEALIRASAADDTARPAFESALRTRFLDDVRRQALSVATEDEHTARADGGASSWWQSLQTTLGFGAAGSASHGSRQLLVPAALVVLVAVFGWVVLSDGPSSLLSPPAVTAAELGAANAEAWAEVDSLAGAFEMADGSRYEEWVVWSDQGLDRYRRRRTPADLEDGGGEWLVSDGQEEWVVDGSSGAVVASRPVPPGLVDVDLGCVHLALPANLAGAVTPERLDGRAMYRVAPSGPGSETLIAAYWVDADDHLVYRIDGHDGQVLWQRLSLELNPDVPVELFDPANLERLGA